MDVRQQRNQRRQQQYEHCLHQATSLRDESALAQGIEDPESYGVVVIPVNERPLAALTRRRRCRFVKRLERLIEDALLQPLPEQESDDRPDTERALPILEAACATCQGKCCLRGGTRAYLDEAAIRRFLRRHHEAGARDILEAYYRLLPRESYRNSCVFHSATGCSLPKYMRSEACLNFVCSGVIELQQRIDLDDESKFFLAAASVERIVRSTYDSLIG